MIQDIQPSILDICYRKHETGKEDIVFVFDADGKVLCTADDHHLIFPEYYQTVPSDTVYLFSIDRKRYFLSLGDLDTYPSGFEFSSLMDLRSIFTGNQIFALFTAYHLFVWYKDNKYCSRCKTGLKYSDCERSLICPVCGNTIYPRINPAVIVGVINGDSLLITRYRKGYAHNALIAGFCEIGESFEDTVKREVMEEAGIAVKNIRYYKSQPWGLAQDILAGFFCEADGDTHICIDENELKSASFVKREEIELQPDDLSLTNEMMKTFKNGLI